MGSTKTAKVYWIGPVQGTGETMKEAKANAEHFAAKALERCQHLSARLVVCDGSMRILVQGAEHVCESRAMLVPESLSEGIHMIDWCSFDNRGLADATRDALVALADTRKYHTIDDVPECVTELKDRRELLKRAIWNRCYIWFQNMGATNPHQAACEWDARFGECEAAGVTFEKYLEDTGRMETLAVYGVSKAAMTLAMA